MKIAYDTGPLASGHAVRGIGFNTSEVLTHLEKQRFVTERLVIDGFDFSQNKKSLNSGRYDIIHSTSFNPYFLSVPIKFRGKLIITIHDLIYLIYPKQYPAGIKGKIKLELQKILLKRADAIITISETSKKDIVRFLGIPSSKIHVIYLAAKKVFKPFDDKNEQERIRKEYKLPKKFILCVGDVNYNKNIPTLIKACRLAKVPLVIVGKRALDIEDQSTDLFSLKGPRDWLRFILNIPHPERAHYRNILKEIKSGGQVIRTGFVSDEDLNVIYSLANIYCMPSYYEGFGLGILEAMACGTPVVASKIQVHVEVGQNACMYADPHKPEEFADLFKKLLKNEKLRSEYTNKGYEHSKKFSWDKSAKETVKVYRAALKNSVK